MLKFSFGTTDELGNIFMSVIKPSEAKRLHGSKQYY